MVNNTQSAELTKNQGDVVMKRALNKIIKGISAASTIDGFCAYLRRCLSVLDANSPEAADFANSLKTLFQGMAADCRKNSVIYTAPDEIPVVARIYCDLSACMTFTGFRIHLCKDEREIRNQVEFLLDFFNNCMTKAQSSSLTSNEVCEMLGLVQQKYRLLSAVAYERELEIYLINRAHFCYDSFLLTYKNTHNGTWLDKWLLFSLSPRSEMLECNKYFVFVHETGHMLYNAVTGGGEVLPELFGEIAFLLGLSLKEDVNCPEELFADLFSAVTLNGTAYSHFNPYGKSFSKEIYELLELYFRMLAGNAQRDLYGNTGISGMLH